VGEAISDLQQGSKKVFSDTGFRKDLESLFHHLPYTGNGVPNQVERVHTIKTQLRFSLYQMFKTKNIDPRILGIPSEKVTKAELSKIKENLAGMKYPAKSADGRVLATDERELIKLVVDLKTKKHSQRVLEWSEPARTVVTVADDYVHPFAPRTFTVRELARFQGFPDTFEFKAKETTGGLNRRNEVPQYSQVGNAVSPFLALAVGKLASRVLK
jgi:DNA (cytosine-5)-methyltransferase 1